MSDAPQGYPRNVPIWLLRSRRLWVKPRYELWTFFSSMKRNVSASELKIPARFRRVVAALASVVAVSLPAGLSPWVAQAMWRGFESDVQSRIPERHRASGSNAPRRKYNSIPAARQACRPAPTTSAPSRAKAMAAAAPMLPPVPVTMQPFPRAVSTFKTSRIATRGLVCGPARSLTPAAIRPGCADGGR